MIWILPLLVVGVAVLLSLPLGRYLTWALDRGAATNVFERWIDTGPQNARQYCLAMLSLSLLAFLCGFVVLALQPLLPLNPDGKGALSPSTIFNTASSFLTNTNLQHYAGEQHLSYFSQLFFITWKQFVTPAVGLAALLAVIRGLRGDDHLGNLYLDVWRGVFYVFLPLSLVLGLLLIVAGMPMTLEGAARVTTLDGSEQTIARGPVAALVAIKQLGTNGGGFFGVNSAHPFENPNAWSNLLENIAILVMPMACVVLFGQMLRQTGQALMIFAVMLVFLLGFVGWAIVTDTLAPNPGLTELPVAQTQGNLEGKELRFGRAAGATWAASTTCTSNGSVNCMHDSLNPLAGLSPLGAMWLNCVFGGVGVGLINFLVYLIVAVFLAGLMVGRTPEYLGKKVEAREMKLAVLALLIHPLLVLAPTGLAAVSDWGTGATSNPGAHGLTQMLYEFTSASANNGSGFEGLADGVASADDAAKPENADAARRGWIWDVSTALIMLFGRYVPILAPILLAASLAQKKRTPFTTGTLRTDTLTFGVLLLGTIVLVGALLFLPVAALGPVAESLAPMPR
jgi:K+-transporting ATPase ATPase A chain